MTIAVFGTFDVANYGDLLFPLLAGRRLAAIDENVRAVAPTACRPMQDAATTLSVDDLLDPRGSDEAIPALSGVLLGGGNLLHASATSRVYGALEPPRPFAYPSLWLGAARLAARHGVPLAWNAPGAPAALAPAAAAAMSVASRDARPRAVRDEGSRAILAAAGIDAELAPDPGLDVSDLWDRNELLALHRELVGEVAPNGRTVAFHVSPRRVLDDVATVAAAFDGIATALDATPLLVAIGPCHDDGALLERIAAELDRPAVVLAHPQRLIEIAASIAGSVAYLGSSMHGAITAVAYGRRAVLVAARADHKLAGLCDHLNGALPRHERWGEAVVALDSWPSEEVVAEVVADARRRLDAHWQGVLASLVGSAPSSANTADVEDAALMRRLLEEVLAETAARARHLEHGLDRAQQVIGLRETRLQRQDTELGKLRAETARLATALVETERDRARIAAIAARQRAGDLPSADRSFNRTRVLLNQPTTLALPQDASGWIETELCARPEFPDRFRLSLSFHCEQRGGDVEFQLLLRTADPDDFYWGHVPPGPADNDDWEQCLDSTELAAVGQPRWDRVETLVLRGKQKGREAVRLDLGRVAVHHH